MNLCNRCGECCRRGGPCRLRIWAGLPIDFEGVCQLLTAAGECRMMKERPMLAIRQYFGVDGTCDFPHLRVAEGGDGDYR